MRGSRRYLCRRPSQVPDLLSHLTLLFLGQPFLRCVNTPAEPITKGWISDASSAPEKLLSPKHWAESRLAIWFLPAPMWYRAAIRQPQVSREVMSMPALWCAWWCELCRWTVGRCGAFLGPDTFFPKPNVSGLQTSSNQLWAGTRAQKIHGLECRIGPYLSGSCTSVFSWLPIALAKSLLEISKKHCA